MQRLRSLPVPSAVAVAVALGLGAMLRYPGGTLLDPGSRGYSLTGNFLSDLGMTVAHDGRANALGALLFVLSLLLLIVALGAGALRCIRRYLHIPRSRRWALGAAGLALLTSTAFVGVAVTPENLVLPLHVSATILAWRAFAVAAALVTM